MIWVLAAWLVQLVVSAIFDSPWYAVPAVVVAYALICVDRKAGENDAK